MTVAFRGVNPNGGSDVRTTALAINQILAGKLNAVTDVTLTANQATTVIEDPRIGVNSYLDFDPLTANAATEKEAGTLYVLAANRIKGQATITHANNAQTDRSYKLLIIG